MSTEIASPEQMRVMERVALKTLTTQANSGDTKAAIELLRRIDQIRGPTALAVVEEPEEAYDEHVFNARAWAKAFVVVEPRPPGKRGRNSKYTIKRVALVLQSLYDGCPDSMAGQSIGISHDTFYQWKKKPEFAEACDRAKAIGLSGILGEVTKTVRGRKCTACKNGIRRGQVCPACKGTTFAVKPDGRLGLMVAERRVTGYAKKDTLDINIAGTVEVVGTVTHAHVQFDALPAETLRELAWGAPLAIEGADVIEAEDG